MLTILTKEIITGRVIESLQYRFISDSDKEKFIKNETSKRGFTYKQVNENTYVAFSDDHTLSKIMKIVLYK